MGSRTRSAWTTWACSAALLLLSGCAELTIGPRVEKKAIIVKAGVPVEILQNKTLPCRVLTDADGEYDEWQQDVGGWVAFHPDHWKSLKASVDALKAEVARLKAKCGEK